VIKSSVIISTPSSPNKFIYIVISIMRKCAAEHAA